MGYDLHITRAQNWIDAEERPISRVAWETFAAAHLDEDGELTLADTGTEPVYSHECATGDVVSLHWWQDQITVTGLTTTQSVSSLRWIAEELDAFLVGDDGETY